MKRAKRRRVNRRVEQRTSFTDRVRPFKSGLRTFVLMALLVGSGFGIYELRDHLSMDDGLILDTVEISGQYRASEEEILMYSGLERGSPLLEVDLEKVARAVRAHPWVKHVTVRRQLVDKITIKVWEHQPAFLASIDKLYVVSDEHHIFKQYTGRDLLDLPVVSGLTEKSPRAHFAKAMELLDGLKSYRDSLGDVGEIRFDDTLGWSVVFESARLSPGFTLHLGRNQNENWLLLKCLWKHLISKASAQQKFGWILSLNPTEYPYEFVRVLIIQFQTH